MKMQGLGKGEAIDMALKGKIVYMLKPVTEATTIQELARCGKFCMEVEEVTVPEEEEPKKEKPAEIDHGKIVALYNAKPSWTISKIADEMKCSPQTVINHLIREGIYKKKKGDLA